MSPEEARAYLYQDELAAPDAGYMAESQNYVPPMSQGQQDMQDVGSSLNAYLKSAAYGGDTLTHGITGPLMENLGPDWLAQGSRQLAEKRQAEQAQLAQDYPTASFLGDMSGKALVSSPLNYIFPGSSEAFIPRAANNAAAGLLSGMAEYGPLEQRLQSGALSGAGSVLFPEAIRGIGKGITRTVTESELPEKAKALIATGEKENIPVFAQDIAEPGSMIEKAGVLSEKPLFWNTIAKRLEQQKAAKEAATRLSKKYDEEMVRMAFDTDKGMQTIERVAKGTGKRAKQAQKILDDIKSGGDDWNYVIKTSGNKKLLQNKLIADEMYEQVGRIASTKGDLNVAPILKQVDGFLEQLNKFPETNKDAIKAISAMRKDLIKRTPEVAPSKILGPNGKPVTPGKAATEAPQQLTFDELREIRSTLNDKISDFYSGKNTLIGKKGVQYLQRLQGNIENELEKFATTNGDELKNAWKSADSFYKKEVIPFKDAAIVKALKNETDPDKIYSMFIKSGGDVGDYGTGRAVKFFSSLDAKGQAAVRFGMVKNALYNAVDEKGVFSPAKYASYLEKLKASRDVFFKGESGKEVDGLVNLMRHIERAGQMKAPETGVQSLGYLLAGKMGDLGVKAGATAVGAFGGLNALLTTAKGRNFLLSAAKLPADSPKWKGLVNNIGELVKSKASPTGRALATKKELTIPATSTAVAAAKKLRKDKESQ